MLGDRAIDHRELLAEEVDLAQAAVERVALVGGQHERRHPLAAGLAEQVADLRARDQVADQDGGHFVLGPGPLADELRAARREPPQRARGLVGDPDLREQVGGQQLGQRARVDAVVLDLRVADRADLHRIGEHDLARRGRAGCWRSPTRCRSTPAPPDRRARGWRRTARAPRAWCRSGRPIAPGRVRRSRPRRSRDAHPDRDTASVSLLVAGLGRSEGPNDNYGVGVDLGRVAGLTAGPFPQAALRTGRASCPASGSPRTCRWS